MNMLYMVTWTLYPETFDEALQYYTMTVKMTANNWVMR